MGYDLLTVEATMQTLLMKSLAEASKMLLSSCGDARMLDAGAMLFKEWIELVDFSYWNHISSTNSEAACNSRTASLLLLCSKKKMKRQKCRFIEPSFYVCA